MKNFFFDTANIEFITNVWSKLNHHINKELVTGVTTNPNAFYKIGKLKIDEWFEHTKNLCKLITDIRKDDRGVVYIQCPNSNMSPEEVLEYAKKVSNLTDGHTRIGLKITPKTEILKINKELQKYVETNVTGLSDCSTAIKCASYDVDYISIIPGRMEEVGIDAKSHIAFVKNSNLKNTQIIAGSMRTIDGLIWTFQYGTVPTIGEKVWNTILEDNNINRLLNIDYNINTNVSQFSPSIDNRNYDLSVSFFNQMDDCGKQAYEELITNN